MRRTIFEAEHEAYREQVRRFVAAEIAPFSLAWDEVGSVPRDLWLKAGAAGLLCPALSEAYGGGGGDRLHSAVVMEEVAGAGFFGPGFGLHSDIVVPYIEAYGSEEQKQRYLARMARGEVIGAIAMTEPAAGSDLQGIKTTAVRTTGGYRINGQKTFITNGQMADVVIVVAKTEPAAGGKGMSLFLIDRDAAGFGRGPNLHKLGMHSQDTAELFFDDVLVDETALLGPKNGAFPLMMKELAWERLQIAIMAAALLENALGWTIDYTAGRTAFGKAIIEFQNTRFQLAEAKAEIVVARTFVDHCLSQVITGDLDATTAAIAKYWTTEIQSRIVDSLLQLHGGYGYMWEYPICRAFADTRVQRIFGGPNEIMKEVIARSLRPNNR